MKLEDVIYIDASPEVVWTATEDIERWGEWSPFVESISQLDKGPFGPGSTASIKQRGLPRVQWQVTVFNPGKMFTWESRLWGIHMVATHEVNPSGTTVQSVLRIEMLGSVAILLGPLLRSPVRRSLEAENAGLKAFCEAHQGATPKPTG